MTVLHGGPLCLPLLSEVDGVVSLVLTHTRALAGGRGEAGAGAGATEPATFTFTSLSLSLSLLPQLNYISFVRQLLPIDAVLSQQFALK